MKIEGLYVDDLRQLPEQYENKWEIARTYREAINKLSKYKYKYISLDHDIASYENGRERTGYDIVLWLEQEAVEGRYVPEKIYVHSANPAGARRMERGIESIKKIITKNKTEGFAKKDAVILKTLAEQNLLPERTLTEEQEAMLTRALDEKEEFFYHIKRIFDK